MKFLAMKFSSSSLFHDVEVCLSRMDLVSTALAADEDVQLGCGQVGHDRHHC